MLRKGFKGKKLYSVGEERANDMRRQPCSNHCCYNAYHVGEERANDMRQQLLITSGYLVHRIVLLAPTAMVVCLKELRGSKWCESFSLQLTERTIVMSWVSLSVAGEAQRWGIGMNKHIPDL